MVLWPDACHMLSAVWASAEGVQVLGMLVEHAEVLTADWVIGSIQYLDGV